ncbi:MAG: V-type ATP synthase subunit F [Desulfurococcaceae archaeon]
MSEEKTGGVLVISDELTASMYRTLGCEVIEVSNPDELVKSLEANIMRDDLSLILISKELAEPVIDQVDKIISRSKPYVSFIPSYGKIEKPLDLRKMLLQALGMR